MQASNSLSALHIPRVVLLAAVIAPLLVACGSEPIVIPNLTEVPVSQASPTPAASPAVAETPTATPEPTVTPPATPSTMASVEPTPTTPAATVTVAPEPTTTPTLEVEQAPTDLVIRVTSDSVVRYRVKEQFARRNFPNDAVGETSEVTGMVVLDPSGVVQPDRSVIMVNVRTLRSDEDDRDDYLRDHALETDDFPTVEFVVEQTPGLPWPLPEGEEFQFQLQGQMTAHGVTSPVTWEMTARREGDALTGQAQTSLEFKKFNMEKPSVFILLSVEDNIRLEFDLVASLTRGS